MNAAGIRLNGLTGIAAILRFELPSLQDMVDEDEGDLDSEEEGEMGQSVKNDTEEDDKSQNSKKKQKSTDDKEETKSGHAKSDASSNIDH